MLAAFAAGMLALGGINLAMDVTSETEFCLSCHEMRAFVFPDYAASAHYSNASGVRAECADCHLPAQTWLTRVGHKIYVSKDLYFHLTGKIDTAEKFEAHRLTMAQREWDRLKANDSLECRSCHAFESMNADAQPRFASRQHAAATQRGETCIDCHKGLVHALPTDTGAPAEF